MKKSKSPFTIEKSTTYRVLFNGGGQNALMREFSPITHSDPKRAAETFLRWQEDLMTGPLIPFDQVPEKRRSPLRKEKKAEILSQHSLTPNMTIQDLADAFGVEVRQVKHILK